MPNNFVSNSDAQSLIGKVGDRLELRPKTFTGTQTEWNNLTLAQKAEYEIVNFTDDYSPGGGGDGWSPHLIINSDSGSSVTASKNLTVVEAVETSSGIFECDLPGNDYGEWTVSGYLDSTPMTTTIQVLVVQQYNVNFIDGSTVTPVDDVEILLECAGIYNSGITTIQDLLDDNNSLLIVINSNNAINYLVRSTTWATTICSNETAMSYIGLNNYASNTLIADTNWHHVIDLSDYFELVLNYKNPYMISNTEPYGEVIYNGQYSNYYAYKAFDNDSGLNTVWIPNQYGTYYPNDYVGYVFPEAVKLCHARLYNYGGTETAGNSNTGVIRASEDGLNWEEISDRFSVAKNESKWYYIDLNTTKKYRYAEFFMVSGAQFNPTNRGLAELRFYCREDV